MLTSLVTSSLLVKLTASKPCLSMTREILTLATRLLLPRRRLARRVRRPPRRVRRPPRRLRRLPRRVRRLPRRPPRRPPSLLLIPRLLNPDLVTTGAPPPRTPLLTPLDTSSPPVTSTPLSSPLTAGVVTSPRETVSLPPNSMTGMLVSTALVATNVITSMTVEPTVLALATKQIDFSHVTFTINFLKNKSCNFFYIDSHIISMPIIVRVP